MERGRVSRVPIDDDVPAHTEVNGMQSTHGTRSTTVFIDDLDVYQRTIDDSFVPLRLTPAKTDGFSATLTAAGADGVEFTEIASSAQLVERTPESIAQGNGNGYYKVSLILAGSSILIQDGREVVMRPGDISFYDTSRPYSLLFDERFRNLIMMFPKDRLELPPQLTDSLTAVSLGEHHPIASAVASFIAQASPQSAGLSELARTKLAHSSLELLGTMFSAVLDIEAEARGPREALLHKVYAYIGANLASPALSPGSIAAAHYISTRHLHALFHEAGTTVSAWIKERRLERCRTDLLDPALAHRGIAAIATSWGFVDAAHFSRIFRAAYGVSPSELRQA